MDRYEKILRFLHDSGPTPEGFSGIEDDCYEYAVYQMKGEEPTEEEYFEGWLCMIEDAMKMEGN